MAEVYRQLKSLRDTHTIEEMLEELPRLGITTEVLIKIVEVLQVE